MTMRSPRSSFQAILPPMIQSRGPPEIDMPEQFAKYLGGNSNLSEEAGDQNGTTVDYPVRYKPGSTVIGN
jgi:hypothetical protein